MRQAKFSQKYYRVFQFSVLTLILVSKNGWLAQLVERLPYKQDVTGSSPVLPIFSKPVLVTGFVFCNNATCC